MLQLLTESDKKLGNISCKFLTTGGSIGPEDFLKLLFSKK
jgi:hypothetical protein